MPPAAIGMRQPQPAFIAVYLPFDRQPLHCIRSAYRLPVRLHRQPPAQTSAAQLTFAVRHLSSPYRRRHRRHSPAYALRPAHCPSQQPAFIYPSIVVIIVVTRPYRPHRPRSSSFIFAASGNPTPAAVCMRFAFATSTQFDLFT